MTELEQLKQKDEYIKKLEQTMKSLNPEGATYKALERGIQQALDTISDLQGYLLKVDKGYTGSFEQWKHELYLKTLPAMLNSFILGELEREGYL